MPNTVTDVKNSAYWENGQYLYEWDRERGDRYTEAAEKAQEVRWKRLMANRPPRDVLPRKLLPGPDRKPPLYHYGFPFTRTYALDYVCHRHLPVDIPEEDREEFGGRQRGYAGLRDVYILLPDGQGPEGKCHFGLNHGRPFSLEWDGIVSLWTNYNFDERYAYCPDDEKVIKTIKDALAEVEGRRSLKAQWWFDWDNDVGLFHLQ
ncbi:hypothetical protein DICSQDRAFT_180605 [Dichomitus squalens LYAD-421 SS1]|uniref:Uncharacterized protein n=1 Tax=Dichomitus squalens (strain LYAD-421) TaxID=732165 RepID=R7SZS4_DICSQ|nr:uncharacterized protein DICSQDRAFT_180605 [Dichomitus squalens LYAD-421 SS1]EJF61591.1 hypothetical protein DICSQDRAFT_180605 [Dichomitus squalens LYAD-421 SS1]